MIIKNLKVKDNNKIIKLNNSKAKIKVSMIIKRLYTHKLIHKSIVCLSAVHLSAFNNINLIFKTNGKQ